MGLLRGKDNGCGWIATYNACIMLGEKVHPAKIIRYFESTNGILLFGALGVNYGSIRVFFWERGYKVKMTFDSYNFDEVAQNNKANIILFQTSSKTWHYVAFTWNGSEYLMYNIESKYKSVFRSPYILSLYRNGGKPIVLISIS